MNAKRLLMALIAAAVLSSQVTIAIAQSGRHRSGWTAVARNGQSLINRQSDDSNQKAATEAQVSVARSEADKLKLVGTWVMQVPDSPGAPGFSALQTYNDDGTMTETSSLLAQLVEGPAHGVWSGKKNDYQVTFELFTFDEEGQSVGRIRVRAAIRLIDNDHLVADAVVDFIDLNGNVEAGIGASPFTGTRVKVLPN